MLSDNTAIYPLQSQPHLNSSTLVKSFYYEFFIDLAPFCDDNFKVASMRLVNSTELSKHLREVLTEEMKSSIFAKYHNVSTKS